MLRKVAFRLGPLKTFRQGPLAGIPALHDFLANRLGFWPASDRRDHAHAAMRLLAAHDIIDRTAKHDLGHLPCRRLLERLADVGELFDLVEVEGLAEERVLVSECCVKARAS